MRFIGSLSVAAKGLPSIIPPPERCMSCAPIFSKRSITRSSSSSRRSSSAIRSDRSIGVGAIAEKPTMRQAWLVAEPMSPPTPVVFWP